MVNISDNNKSKTIKAGKISSAHGVKGYVKIYSYLESPENFKLYQNFFDESGNKIEIDFKFTKGNFIIAELNNIKSREEAEKAKGKEIFILKSDLPELQNDDEFYYDDLIGLEVICSNTQKKLGTIKAVHNFGADDIVEIEYNDGNKEIFNFNEKNFPELNLKQRQIHFRKPDIIFS